MTMLSLLSTASTVASAVVHPHVSSLTATQLALTVGVGGVGAVLLRTRRRRPLGRVPGPTGGEALVAAPAGARPAGPAATAPAPSATTMTCRPQLLTPPGTARALGEVEQWLARGELDAETYRDLRRVFAEVEAARD